MKKWYDEEFEFKIEVTGFLRGDHTERYCRNGEEPGDTYTCTYGCPVNADGEGSIDFSKFRPISFEPAHNAYHVLGEKVGNAFLDGSALK